MDDFSEILKKLQKEHDENYVKNNNQLILAYEIVINDLNELIDYYRRKYLTDENVWNEAITLKQKSKTDVMIDDVYFDLIISIHNKKKDLRKMINFLKRNKIKHEKSLIHFKKINKIKG